MIKEKHIKDLKNTNKSINFTLSQQTQHSHNLFKDVFFLFFIKKKSKFNLTINLHKTKE